MTTVTDREVPARVNGAVPRIDSPAVRAPARARVPVTESAGKISPPTSSITVAARRWWVFTNRPASLRALWRLSAVDPSRVPGRNSTLTVAWRVSNWTDRLLMFAFIAAAPTFLTGPLRWCAVRPTRRWALYLVTAALAVTYTLGRG